MQSDEGNFRESQDRKARFFWWQMAGWIFLALGALGLAMDIDRAAIGGLGAAVGCIWMQVSQVRP